MRRSVFYRPPDGRYFLDTRRMLETTRGRLVAALVEYDHMWLIDQTQKEYLDHEELVYKILCVKLFIKALSI